tara:strand:- start:422 stop:631 length:210 start_codon:yes stop_codon:yes gene_type:complete
MRENLISINNTNHILPPPVIQFPVIKEDDCGEKCCKKIEWWAPVVCYLLILILIVSFTLSNYNDGNFRG